MLRNVSHLLLLFLLHLRLVLVTCLPQNEVERLTTTIDSGVDYGELRCTRPTITEGMRTPEPNTETIGVYETYTITCLDTHHIKKGDKMIVDIDNVLTCTPGADSSSASLQPSSPSCVENENIDLAVNLEKEKVSSLQGISDGVGCVVLSVDEQTFESSFKAIDCSSTSDNYKIVFGVDLGCIAEDLTLVGYYALRTTDTSHKLAVDITSDASLSLTAYCVDSGTSVCERVNEEGHSDSHMHVHIYRYKYPSTGEQDQTLSMNIAAGDDSVSYRIRCDEGFAYSYESGVERDGYGYCETSGGDDPSGNTFKVKADPSDTDYLQCHPLCPANPDMSQFVDDSPISVQSVYLPAMRHGETFTLAQDAVICGEGTAFETGTSSSEYEVSCDSSSATEANSGLLSCTSCPVCHLLCTTEFNIPEDNAIQAISFSSVNKGATVTVTKEDITCKDGHIMSLSAADTYTFACGAEGTFECAGDCPICEGTCTWPEETGDLLYRYALEDLERDDTVVIPGVNHVEAYCADETQVLVGPRYMSCTGLNNNTLYFDTTGYPDNQTDTTCQTNLTVCGAPVAEGVTLSKTGNVLLGDEYTMSCNQGWMFDLDLRESWPDSTFVVTCVAPAVNESTGAEGIINDNLYSPPCYKGCDEVEGFMGTLAPSPTTAGSAPYTTGQDVTFSCPTDYHLAIASEKVQQCSESGTITVPECVEDNDEEEVGQGQCAVVGLGLLSLCLAMWL